MSLNAAKRSLLIQVTLVGSIDAKRCPKLTALELLHGHLLPRHELGDLVSIATEGDRTLFFERKQRDERNGLTIRESYLTAAGAVFYSATRKLALKNASAVVFAPTLLRDRLDDTTRSSASSSSSSICARTTEI